LAAPASVLPATDSIFVGGSGNVKISIIQPGIAVRIEIPRWFLPYWRENDTSFIESNIRNDYYYTSVIDESQHWSYDWRGNVSDGPCYKPGFSLHDPNAPYCVEIWNYLNAPSLKEPDPTVNYCQTSLKYVFTCFSPPKFVLFRNLQAPAIAGVYNFTVSIAYRTNALGYPDFVNAWNTYQLVPVSMTYNPEAIKGQIVDSFTETRILAKGLVIARQCFQTLGGVCLQYGPVVARAFVNPTDGTYTLTGLDPGPNQSPLLYTLQASAGSFDGVAYALSSPTALAPVQPSDGGGNNTIQLNRAVQLTGTIEYQDAAGDSDVSYSLTDNKYLMASGFNANPQFKLNVTVEADVNFSFTQNEVTVYTYRYMGTSTNSSKDAFTIVTGNGTNYVGTDPSGTEFAGLPDPSMAYGQEYTVTIRVWVSGWVQMPEFSITIKPHDMPQGLSGLEKSTGNHIMRPGGFITGRLIFTNFNTGLPQSPAAAASNASEVFGVPISSTATLYGGNIIIQAFSHSSHLLMGMTVINGTLPNGTARYSSESSILFTIVGFSEYYNHSWSGIWNEPDSGLPDDYYDLNIFVRGYEMQALLQPVQVGTPGNYGDTSRSVSVTMFSGGAFKVIVGSYDNRFGTRAIQAAMPWRFLNLSIPVTARVYFCDPDCNSGAILGYVERLMVTNFPGGVDQESFTVVFGGMNPSLREIWFYGPPECSSLTHTFLGCPTHVYTGSTYSISAYTLGYVPADLSPSPISNGLSQCVPDAIALFIGNEVDITVPVLRSPNAGIESSDSIPENDYPVGEVFSTGLSGAVMANATDGTTTLDFPVFGIGGMDPVMFPPGLIWPYIVQHGLGIVGQGHFFYEASDGTLNYDYGLDNETYSAQLAQPSDLPCQVCVKGFGFTMHFMQVSPNPQVTFGDLFLEQGVFLTIYAMAGVTSPPAIGWTGDDLDPDLLTNLTWVQVSATGIYNVTLTGLNYSLSYNASYSGFSSTLDGTFDAEDALQLPGGVYTITYSDAFYQSCTVTNVPVSWSQVDASVTNSSIPFVPPVPLPPVGTSLPCGYNPSPYGQFSQSASLEILSHQSIIENGNPRTDVNSAFGTTISGIKDSFELMLHYSQLCFLTIGNIVIIGTVQKVPLPQESGHRRKF
jgi:hypothetical protein